MQLVIVESPAKAKTINKYLGKDYVVVSSYGHVRDIPSKEGSVLPEQNFAINYEVPPQSQKHVKKILDDAKKADGIIIASDPDREGEAIAWHIAEILRSKKVLKKGVEIKRSVFHEITKQAVTEAIQNTRDINIDLVDAQQARRALDYLVGFTLSPILWRKLPGSRSAGRVQSVALRIICDRETEIEQFIVREYWTIDGRFEGATKEAFTAQLVTLEGKKLDKFDLPTESDANRVKAELLKRNYIIQSVEKKQQVRNPYAPFITSTLQQEASKKLGFGAKRTMSLAQQLYEGVDVGGETVALITYMRTDGVNLAGEAVAQARKYIQQTFGDQYLPNSPRMYKTKVRNAQEAHEAIRPTNMFLTPTELRSKMNQDQWKLYDLVWKRTIACQMSNVVLDQVVVMVAATDNYAALKATGSTIAFDGFYRVYNKEQADDGGKERADERDEAVLPVLAQGEQLNLLDILPEQHFTDPPPRYSEASLVKRLEELGIGRPSTYASIISVLQDREYVRLDNKRFFPEERGRIVTAFLVSFFPKYVEYDFTAKLEDELDLISNGELGWKIFLQEFWKHFHPDSETVMSYDRSKILEAITKIMEQHLFSKVSGLVSGEVSGTDGRAEASAKAGSGVEILEANKLCPTCKEGTLSIKLSKFGPFIGCSRYPECKYTRKLDATAGNGDSSSGNGEDKVLGTDPQTGKDVLLKKGPYGFYVQLREAETATKTKVKPKRHSLPAGTKPEDMTLDGALKLMSLPREVGLHPTTGEPIMASIGKFGPYLLYNKQYTNLPSVEKVFEIGADEAIKLIESKTKFGGTVLGQHEGKDVTLTKGRFGPYIKFGDANVRIPKGTNMDSLNYDEAVKIIQAAPATPEVSSDGKKPARTWKRRS